MRIGRAVKRLCFSGVVVLICVAVAHAVAINTETQNEPQSPEPPYTPHTDGSDTDRYTDGKLPAGIPDAIPGFPMTIPVAEIADTRYLELINQDHPIGAHPESGLIVTAWPDIPVSTIDKTIHQTALAAVREMFAEARCIYDSTFYLSSGYRNYDEQKQVYDDAPDKSYVAMPNHSEHHSGLAADIFILGVGQYDMENSDEACWLAENAWKYGMLLRYTESKRDITGVAGEPWHFRYVGLIHAWYCYDNRLCFEEYVQFLKASGGYHADVNGISYSISYQTPTNGLLYIPESGSYDISSDNTGGYIITAWE